MKIVKDSRVREYELTYLLSAKLTTEEVQSLLASVNDLIKKNHGTVLATEEWGKKELSYPLKFKGSFHREAIYTHQVVEFDSKHVQAFEKDFYLMPEIMRHLLVMAQKDQPIPVADQSDKVVQSQKSDDEEKADEKDKN